jgi:hypothetical protein
MSTRMIVYGLIFGFVLSRAGATDYDAIAGMFRLTDLHLFGVIGTAVALNAIRLRLAPSRRGARARRRRARPRAQADDPRAGRRQPDLRRRLGGGGRLPGDRAGPDSARAG